MTVVWGPRRSYHQAEIRNYNDQNSMVELLEGYCKHQISKILYKLPLV